MDKSIVQMLGLFNVPPQLRKKVTEDKAVDNQLLNSHKDFFAADQPEEESKEAKEADKINKLREKHLIQMDNTKKMYIDQILRKTTYFDDFDYFSEVTG